MNLGRRMRFRSKPRLLPAGRVPSPFQMTRRQLGPIPHALAQQKECQIVEGHLLPDHVHMCIAIPPKHPVASVIGFSKGRARSRLLDCAARTETSMANISGPAVTPFRRSSLTWNKSANTSASRRTRTEQRDSFEVLTEARFSVTSS